MIILLGAAQMIIKRLEIKGLYGVYNYNVSFNEDLTFLFGENGCGKTTILDIVSSIVTGKLYKLFRYQFDEIILSFREKKRAKLDRVRIKNINDTYIAILDGKDLHERIENPYITGEMYSRDEDENVFDRRFLNKYVISRILRESFRYIYLPLGRTSQDGNDLVDGFTYRRRHALFLSEKDYENKNYLNESLRHVEEIVKTGCMRISSAENRISEQFKSSIFTSSLRVVKEYNLNKLFESIRSKETLASIEQNRTEYIKTLESIGELNDEAQKRIDDFFKRYKTAFENAQNDDQKGHPGISIELLLLNNEFNRIKDIATEAQKIEKEKERIREPITAFLSTVNDFFSISEDRKCVKINEGRIIIEADSPHRKLSLYKLSSGEKQIVIIFAFLVFGLLESQGGIYIIDEPEASLHLSWQRKFVESIRKANNAIQLVFATHSPEIIGKYADRAVKLERMISTNPIEKEDEFQ